MSIKITCINKDDGNHENPYTAISHLNWLNDATMLTGRSTRLEMYNFLNNGGYAYVVDSLDNSKVYLEARISSGGTKYVKTKANDTGRDNLLSLPECK